MLTVLEGAFGGPHEQGTLSELAGILNATADWCAAHGAPAAADTYRQAARTLYSLDGRLYNEIRTHLQDNYHQRGTTPTAPAASPTPAPAGQPAPKQRAR